MEFVTFHVALDDRDPVHPNQTLAHDQYLSMIARMFASARLFHPQARRVVLSDRLTRFGYAAHSIDELRRSDIDGAQLMMERARAQLRHVRESAFERPMIVLDSDILINGSLSEVCERPFDVALTWRASHDQPINGGFMILNNQRPEVTRAFFERYMQIYEERYSQQAAWFGDQLALRDCLGLDHHQLSRHEEVEVEGCRILLLPCDTFNFSPENTAAAIDSDLRDKRVLHFKGERKRLMPAFWRAWLRPREEGTPEVLARAERERASLREMQAAEQQALEQQALEEQALQQQALEQKELEQQPAAGETTAPGVQA